MNPEKLISTLLKTGIHLTYNERRLVFWPSHMLTNQDLHWLKALKPEVIFLLKGFHELKLGDPFIVGRQAYRINQVYPELGRISGTCPTSKSQNFFNLDQVAHLQWMRILNLRLDFIESNIESHPEGHRQNEIFQLYEFEWRYLFSELNRQKYAVSEHDNAIISDKTAMGV